jgi:hypothetical protein
MGGKIMGRMCFFLGCGVFICALGKDSSASVEKKEGDL